MEKIIFRLPVSNERVLEATKALAIARKGEQLVDEIFVRTNGLELNYCIALREKAADVKLMAAVTAGFRTVKDMEDYLEIYKKL